MDGTVVEPGQVVGPPRPGHRVVYTGDTRPTASTASVVSDADLLIHDAMFTHDHTERARHTKHSTVREAAELAVEAVVKRLTLTHVSSGGANKVGQLEQEALDVFGSDAFFPTDGDSVSVSFPDTESKS